MSSRESDILAPDASDGPWTLKKDCPLGRSVLPIGCACPGACLGRRRFPDRRLALMDIVIRDLAWIGGCQFDALGPGEAERVICQIEEQWGRSRMLRGRGMSL